MGSSSTTTGGASATMDASARQLPRAAVHEEGVLAGVEAEFLDERVHAGVGLRGRPSPSASKPNSSSSRTVLQQIWRSGFWNRKPTVRAKALVLRLGGGHAVHEHLAGIGLQQGR